MNAAIKRHCACRVASDGTWLSACPAHAEKFAQLSRRAAAQYEMERRRAIQESHRGRSQASA
jgi:GrpB-like predicted nucleotidyltransferase (UPF0157 family)